MTYDIAPDQFVAEVFQTTLDTFTVQSKPASLKSLVIDIRGEEEFKEGHIPQSLNVPFATLPQFLAGLKASREKDIVLYFFCWAGNTSQIACSIAESQGFHSKSIMGGANAWQWMDFPFAT